MPRQTPILQQPPAPARAMSVADLDPMLATAMLDFKLPLGRLLELQRVGVPASGAAMATWPGKTMLVAGGPMAAEAAEADNHAALAGLPGQQGPLSPARPSSPLSARHRSSIDPASRQPSSERMHAQAELPVRASMASESSTSSSRSSDNGSSDSSAGDAWADVMASKRQQEGSKQPPPLLPGLAEQSLWQKAGAVVKVGGMRRHWAPVTLRAWLPMAD